jgi:hypothetical protein
MSYDKSDKIYHEKREIFRLETKLLFNKHFEELQGQKVRIKLALDLEALNLKGK